MKILRTPILNIIRKRRTIRKFILKKVSNTTINTLIEAARWAPCPNNLQPWRFCAVANYSPVSKRVVKYLENEAKKKSIGVSVFLKDAIQIIKNAPVSIFVFNTKVVSSKYKILGDIYQKQGVVFEIQAISAAIQNLALEAEELKLGTVWLGSPLFLHRGIENMFKTKHDLVAIIGIGYFNIKPKNIPRLPVSEILRFYK